jgi:cytochrome c peroxidase
MYQLVLALTMCLVVMNGQAAVNLNHSQAQKQALGKLIFEDKTLSEPAGQACSSCHQANNFYADPGKAISPGANPKLFSNRNVPSIAYGKFTPELYWNKEEALWMGGFFYDGRAKTMKEQAAGPFLNPLEMGNTTQQQVVEKLKKSTYRTFIESQYGIKIWDNNDKAFKAAIDAIVAYENGPEFGLFNSKYDYFLQGKAELTKQEKLGLELFDAEDKGNCAACHTSAAENNKPLFTDYSYDNLGQPANKSLAFYKIDKRFNPAGKMYVDYGLANNPHINNGQDEKGKFKVPTLRNIDKTGPYLHNGVFDSLKEVVEFYNERDVKEKWGNPEVNENVNSEELGDLKLTKTEVDAIVVFMKTLTDGYKFN